MHFIPLLGNTLITVKLKKFTQSDFNQISIDLIGLMIECLCTALTTEISQDVVQCS